MAGRLERYIPNRDGLRALLRSQPVRAMLHGRAERVAAVAQGAYDGPYQPHTGRVEVGADSEIGRGRARAAVIADHPGALPIEAEHRVLGGVIDTL